LETSKDLNLVPVFSMLNNNNSFDTLIVDSIRKNCEKVCEIFQDVYVKWQALSSDNGPSDSAKPNRRISVVRDDDNKTFNSNLNAPTAMAKKAINIFKHTMLKQKSPSDEYFSEKHQADNLNLVKVTNLSHRASTADNMTMQNENGRKSAVDVKRKQAKMIQQLVSSVELSLKVVIINPNLNNQIKKTARKYLTPVIDSFETIEEVHEIFDRLFPQIRTTTSSLDEIKEFIFDEMFPNYSYRL
jgi:hypothetical protein